MLLLLALPLLAASARGQQSNLEAKRARQEEQKRISGLLREYYKALRNPEAQEAIVKRAVEMGPNAAGRLQENIQKKLMPQLDRYRQKFAEAALRLTAGKVSQTSPGEIDAMRLKYRELWRDEGLSKGQIKSVGDPILQRLETVLIVSREQILEMTPKLREERENLQKLGSQWETCAKAVYEDALESADEAAREFLTEPSFNNYLEGEETLAARMAIPTPPQDKLILAGNRRLSGKIDREEAKAVLSTNLMRILLGKNALALDLRLVAAARDHSSDMKRLNFFDHESKVPGKRTFTDRAKNFGASASGENIAIGSKDGRGVAMQWYYSPGHHKNMFGNHKRIGIGRAGRHWTEMFGR